MSLSRFTLLALLALITSACGASLSEHHQLNAALGQIDVKTGNDRAGQLFRHEIERLLSRSPAGDTRYELNTSIRLTYPKDAVDMIVSIELYDQQTGKNVLKKPCGHQPRLGVWPHFTAQRQQKTMPAKDFPSVQLRKPIVI